MENCEVVCATFCLTCAPLFVITSLAATLEIPFTEYPQKSYFSPQNIQTCHTQGSFHCDELEFEKLQIGEGTQLLINLKGL